MGNFFLFLERIAPSWRHLSAWNHAQISGSRVNVIRLRDLIMRGARFSCGFFAIFHSYCTEWEPVLWIKSQYSNYVNWHLIVSCDRKWRCVVIWQKLTELNFTLANSQELCCLRFFCISEFKDHDGDAEDDVDLKLILYRFSHQFSRYPKDETESVSWNISCLELHLLRRDLIH